MFRCNAFKKHKKVKLKTFLKSAAVVVVYRTALIATSIKKNKEMKIPSVLEKLCF